LKGFVAGGEFPSCPRDLCFDLADRSQTVTCTGRHLTWTRKDGQCIEWGLYVPDRHLPKVIWRGLLTRQNPPDRALKEEETSATMHSTIEVTAGDFDELVLGPWPNCPTAARLPRASPMKA